MIPTFLVGIALGPLWPAYREALSRRDIHWVQSTFRRSIRLSLSVAGLVSSALVVLGLPLIAVWVGTSSVQPAFGLILAMGIWTTLIGVGNSWTVLLNAAQVMRFQVVTVIVMATANVVLSIALTSRVGVAGVVLGSIIAYSAFELIPVAVYLPRLFARLESGTAPTAV